MADNGVERLAAQFVEVQSAMDRNTGRLDRITEQLGAMAGRLDVKERIITELHEAVAGVREVTTSLHEDRIVDKATREARARLDGQLEELPEQMRDVRHVLEQHGERLDRIEAAPEPPAGGVGFGRLTDPQVLRWVALIIVAIVFGTTASIGMISGQATWGEVAETARDIRPGAIEAAGE